MKKLIILILILFLGSCFGFGDIIGSVTDTASSAANTVTSTGNSAIDSTTSMFNEAINTIKNTANAAVNQTTSAVSNAINTMKETTDKVISDTQNAMTGAIDNLKDFTNSVIDKIKNLSDEMCETQCISFFNLPCFVIFRCTTKLRNFGLFVVLPIVVLYILIMGVCSGWISVICFFRILGTLTGIYPIYLIVKHCCCTGKDKEQEKEVKEVKNEKEGPLETATRLKNIVT